MVKWTCIMETKYLILKWVQHMSFLKYKLNFLFFEALINGYFLFGSFFFFFFYTLDLGSSSSSTMLILIFLLLRCCWCWCSVLLDIVDLGCSSFSTFFILIFIFVQHSSSWLLLIFQVGVGEVCQWAIHMFVFHM